MSLHTTVWHTRLSDHFDRLSLRETRPIFALEHGLDVNEIHQLFEVLRIEFKERGLLEASWLLWIVYATEYGYDFDGQKFWQEFSDQTPLWNFKGDRKRIKYWFRKFQEKYRSIEPCGSWAEHYTIISWPVTNAILPKDLQRSLARALYLGQREISRAKGNSAIEIGRTVKNSVRHGSTRFLNFLEQEELVGQIVVSLLDPSTHLSDGIDQLTRDRIKNDLSKISDAKHWIDLAKKTWSSHRPQLKPVNSINHSWNPNLKEAPSTTANSRRLITPEVEIKKVGGEWVFELTIPSFNEIAAVSPEYNDFLRTTKVTLPFSGETVYIAGWLLVGVRNKPLNIWPLGGEGLLKFEKNPPFDAQVNWSLSLGTRNVWIFKLSQPSSGHMLWGNQVLPGKSYIALGGRDLDLLDIGEKIETSCKEISAFNLVIPTFISEAYLARLLSLDISVAQTVSIAPCGLPPVKWIDEVGGEWLSNSIPMLAFERDHAFDYYELIVDGSLRRFDAPAGNASTIIELPDLVVGEHQVSLATFNRKNAKPLASRTFTLLITDPKPWVAGESLCPGVYVTYEPLGLTVHDFLTGRLRIDVQGENDVQSDIQIFLKDSTGSTIYKHSLLTKSLPIKSENWQSGYKAFLEKHDSDEEFHLFNSGYISISTKKSGAFRIPLEPFDSPLHWIVRSVTNAPYLRLVQQGSFEEKEVWFSDFRKPLDKYHFKEQEIQCGYKVQRPGGLVFVKSGDQIASAIYAPREVQGGLQKLGVTFEEIKLNDIDGYSDLTKMAETWHRAVPFTHLAAIWQAQLLKHLTQKLISKYCGEKWISAERSLIDHGNVANAFEKLEGLVSPGNNFGLAIGRLRFAFRPSVPDLKLKLSEMFQRYKVRSNPAIFELAWGLAWFDDSYTFIKSEDLRELAKYAVLIRAMRLLCIRYRYSTTLSSRENPQ